MASKKDPLAVHLQSTTRGLVYALLFLLPLWFLPFTVEVLELNKQTLLLVLTFAAALTWIGSMLFARRFPLKRGLVNALPLLILIAAGLSAWNSNAPYLSWVGAGLQEYTSVLTLAGMSILFYLIIHTCGQHTIHRAIHGLLLWSAVLVGVLGLSSLLGWPLLTLGSTSSQGFNTVGTVNALGVYLSVMSAFACALFTSHKNSDALLHKGSRGAWERFASVLLVIITLAVLVLLDYWILWLVFLSGMLLVFVFGFFRARDFVGHTRMWLPMLAIVVALPFWLSLGSPLSTDIPVEVSPSKKTSVQIANNVLSTSAMLGSGPGTYSFDYALHRPISINETDFWNTRFDRASSFALTLAPTFGYVGVIAFSLFVLFLIVKALLHIVKTKSRESWLHVFVALVPLTTIAIAGLLYTFNITLMFLLFVFAGLLASQLVKPANEARDQSGGARLTFSTLFVIGSVIFFAGIFVASERYVAEASFSQALKVEAGSASVQKVVTLLDRSSSLNRFDDRFYRTLSEALLLRVGEQLKSVPDSAELSLESRQYVQSLVAASVNAAVRATDLSPQNVLNWNTRQRVYRELMNVMPNAGTFAIQSGEQTIVLEPNNPRHQNEIGKTYLAMAEQTRSMTVAQDQSVAQKAGQDLETYLQKAESAFSRAIELKANYAPAHFQLGLTYERQGRLDDAISKLESVALYNPLDVGTAFQLGQLYLRRGGDGDLALARASFETAVELAPSYSNARWFLASVYEGEGEMAGAVEQVEAVLKLNPDNALVKQRLDRLLRGDVAENVEVLEAP